MTVQNTNLCNISCDLINRAVGAYQEMFLLWRGKGKAIKQHCYTSQLKFTFQLGENVSRVVGQNSLTP